jgi:hypothetical protein
MDTASRGQTPDPPVKQHLTQPPNPLTPASTSRSPLGASPPGTCYHALPAAPGSTHIDPPGLRGRVSQSGSADDRADRIVPGAATQPASRRPAAALRSATGPVTRHQGQRPGVREGRSDADRYGSWRPGRQVRPMARPDSDRHDAAQLAILRLRWLQCPARRAVPSRQAAAYSRMIWTTGHAEKMHIVAVRNRSARTYGSDVQYDR